MNEHEENEEINLVCVKARPLVMIGTMSIRAMISIIAKARLEAIAVDDHCECPQQVSGPDGEFSSPEPSLQPSPKPPTVSPGPTTESSSEYVPDDSSEMNHIRLLQLRPNQIRESTEPDPVGPDKEIMRNIMTNVFVDLKAKCETKTSNEDYGEYDS